METKKVKHPWWARMGVATAMLLIAFIGIILTDVKSSGGWDFWKWAVPAYAILALWLSWYERRTKDTVNPITLGHELLHWIALYASVYLVSIYVNIGILSRSLAGLFILSLIALAVFLAGIYIEWTFLLVGLILGIFAAIVAIAVQYFYAFSIPVLIIGLVIIALMVWHSHKKKSQ